MRSLRRGCARAAAAGVVLLAVCVGTASANDSHALITGSGASASAVAVQQWVADVLSSGIQVVFTANGSAAGRKDFALKTTDFGVSDTGYEGVTAAGDSDTANGRAYAYLPIVGGGTSFPYHIEVAGKLVRTLRLSGQTLAKIFTNQITNWSDPAVTQDNNGVALPSLPIIPVVHAEGAGTSAEFTKYLAKQFPGIWGPYNGGQNASTDFYPVNGGQMIAENGSDGVMNYVASAAADGAIGMDEYAYPLAKNYPAAKVENAAGFFTLPTQYNDAVALTQAIINSDPTSPDYLLQTLDNVYSYSDPRTYPLSSYDYAIIPTSATDPTMSTAKRQSLADYLYYSICQGQSEIGPIGYSSLPINLVTAGFSQIAKLKQADAGVDLTQRDVSTCNNPTFIAGHPERNYLAQVAPAPAACDQVGKGPCDASVVAVNTNPAPTAKPGATTPAGTGKGGRGGTGGTPGPSATPGAGTPTGGQPGAVQPGVQPTAGPGTGGVLTTATDPLTGQPIPVVAKNGAAQGNGTDSGSSVPTVSTQLAADPQSVLTSVMAPLAAVEVLAILLGPPLWLRWRRRRRAGAV